MEGKINTRMVGATIVGFALVAGAFTARSLTTPQAPTITASVVTSAPTRTPINVYDTDGDEVEDWRDEFITAKPIQLNTPSSTYALPDTITGKMSINFLENLLQSRSSGPFGNTDAEIVNQTVTGLTNAVTSKLYDLEDVSIITDWAGADIVNYANTIATILYNNSIPDMEGELVILSDILQNQNNERVSELKILQGVYISYRNDTLKTPVPEILVKEHLDLINTYQALSEDIAGMTLIIDDPIVTLLHIKRYREDATGLAYALQNMFFALDQSDEIFTEADPALLFSAFSPNFQN